MTEIWKASSISDKILISNLGRVKSLLRDERVLKSQDNGRGYQKVRVTIDGVKKSLVIHREVAKAFVPNPRCVAQVNHIDGDKNNNRADNLEWVTNEENKDHAIASGLWVNVFKASRENAIKSRTPVIATEIATGKQIEFESVCEAQRCLNSKHITDVLKGRRKSVGGYTLALKGVV